MQHKSDFLESYIQKPGVVFSLIITIFSSILLIGTLVSKKIHFDYFIFIALLGLIFEFIYGLGLSFVILRKKEKYIHLTPFLITNWLIGCFCLNTFIPLFHDLPIWVYLATLAFCLSNFFIYQNSDEDRETSISFLLMACHLP